MTTICRVPGCGTKIATKKSGLCMRHYKQDRRGTLQITPAPETGAPSGHGRYGILEDNGVEVLCHECGQWKKVLGMHLNTIHDMTARDYKIRHGLPLGTALMGSEGKQARSADSKARLGSEAWKRLEAKRDPVAASHARDEVSFQAISRYAADTPEKALHALSKVGPKTLRWQECVVCGKRYQKRVTTKTCGAELCQDISRYESQDDFAEMKLRAKMHEVDGLNFSEIARARGVTPQASRLSYRQWQKYQGWKAQIVATTPDTDSEEK